ncbi:hypothetical protein ACK8P5_26445 (plasmid) [Paenibacillus sp. EC2-1]|uniref:hypothetical protein n=1 Tax=Paenibacillus sp. EC2-1 TaxID=3388665 RepID=UPI003BEF4987
MKKRRRDYPQEIKDLLKYKNDIRLVEDDEWEEFEDLYTRAVNSVVIPIDLTPRGITRINAEVDQIYSLARFDQAYAKRMLDKYKGRLANAHKQAKLGFKRTPGSTIEDRDALVTMYLETSPLKGDSEPLYVLVERWQDRQLFMSAVIDTLTRKSDRMITGNGALKLDAQGRGNGGDFGDD